MSPVLWSLVSLCIFSILRMFAHWGVMRARAHTCANRCSRARAHTLAQT